MIINDLHIVGVPVVPDEADAVLIVDPNAVLAMSIAGEGLEAFFAGPLEWTLFDEEDARAAGTVRAELEAVRKPIGAYDVLLAGQARRRGATLVTSYAKEFARVSGLKWEDWAAARR